MHGLTPEVKTIALNLMEGLSCPRSLTVAILLRHNEWKQLVELAVDPRDHLDSESLWAARAATDFLRKHSGLETGIDVEAAALTKWLDSEKECYRTNQKLLALTGMGIPDPSSVDGRLLSFLNSVREEVVNLIGTHPPDLLQGRFGPGATISDRSRASTVPDKMSSKPTLTSNALFHLMPWIGTEWGKASAALGNEPNFVKGNHYFTVPKDATTDRSCGKEPSINVFYQTACGSVLRRRLKANGIDLKNGQNIHRQVACLASITGEFCTIDLTSASDTICTVLVKLLLPFKWWKLLDSLRSPYTRVEGKWILLEKFSSMGNGFTFELETVIFAAIARAVQKTALDRGNVTVYGDDMIVPTSSFDDVIAALTFCGFTPNKRKTFSEGVFRESCGGDYFNGTAVRPHFLKENPFEPQDFISLANGIRRMARQEPHLLHRWSRLRRAWFSCLDNIPSHVRACRGPEDLGDLVIHDDEQSWITRWRSSGIRYLRVYRPAIFRKVRWEGFAYGVQFATALYLAGKGEKSRYPDGDIGERDNVLGYKVGWTAYS